MRIIYRGTVLTDGGSGSPVGLRVAAPRQIQRAAYLRAPYGRVFDRGGRTIDLDWSHTRRFASVSDAQHFAARHGDSIPAGEGVAYLSLSGGTELQLSAAVLEPPELAGYAGTRTTHRYRLRGRELSGGALPAWSAGGAGISFGGASLSGGGVNGFLSYRISGAKGLQSVAHLRAATAAPRDYANALTVMRWEQSRDFDSADAAEQFLLLHGESTPTGTHDLDLALDDGTTLTLADAVVQGPTGRRIAPARTVHSYQAVGRAVTSTSPLPGWLDPNGPGTIDPDALVTHLGETVTFGGDFVVHNP